MKIAGFASSKIAVILMVGLLVFFGNLKFRQYRQQKAIEAEKNTLAQQAAALEQKNRELSESISYFNSDSFRERVARQQLNLKKDGELVYSFSDSGVSQPAVQAQTTSGKPNNARKWWDYFLNSH